MGFFKRAFYGVGMILTGKVLDRIDTQIMAGQGQMSLRLKQKDDASAAYVVVVVRHLSNYATYPLTAEEFDQFAESVQTIRGELSKANGA
jgi:hypothetical protein